MPKLSSFFTKEPSVYLFGGSVCLSSKMIFCGLRTCPFSSLGSFSSLKSCSSNFVHPSKIKVLPFATNSKENTLHQRNKHNFGVFQTAGVERLAKVLPKISSKSFRLSPGGGSLTKLVGLMLAWADCTWAFALNFLNFPTYSTP